MVERYINTAKDKLRRVLASHQRDWDVRSPVVLLAYRASTHTNTDLGRELRLPCDLLFGAPPEKKWPTVDHAVNLLDHLHEIYNYARQNLNVASDRMKTLYDRLATCAG
jgi:hypothetical protein